ncbi:ATP-dependent DNA helicase IV [Enterococcus faecium EnGen0372]|uniref:HelD family protein n=1 Tax=Enterococcus faecium TaxID=1352 RepID=UPI00032F94DD|nr:UvrD-helicase domain-containing protein [Enterococcus faecium]EOG05863.1 ATP-dependent DNA helicase IV [Enterococcus faecium EnGen0171]EOK15123.1 ATP-dependent DNA helicase IV [Enterococcus faecium EnGen0372]EOM41739.1 ATP-dependent DNA helicase IV [Enterococcus faecium EnGen0172]MDT2318367.1 AAA family ATPase [Enterococcus faecium]RBS26803.1 ATP-dependent DNA helicase IV [Enterococcus faecium]
MVNTQKQLEEAYLKNVYQKLIDKKNELRESMDTAKIEGNQSLKEMAGDLRLNFDSYLDNLDTFSMIEMKNREIDQMNIKQKNAENQLAKIERLLKSPYFGKVIVDFLDNEPQESFYIGTANFTDDADENLVYDWRSPIAELFYNNMIGPSSYTVRQNKIDTVIKERRQFILERDRLVKFFDTSVAIQDDVLLEVLGQDETNEMKAITATIQSEQNTIIRDVKSQNILVNGVAGSGKTSAIMQRIAYLLYLYRDTMTSDDLLILSPNHRFIDYISNVLPSLGERNPLNLTIIQLVSQLSAEEIEGEEAYFKRITGENVSEQTERLRSKKFIDNLKQSDPLFLDHPNFIRGLTKNGKTVLSKKTIEKIYEKVPAHPKLIDRLQATKKALMSEWKNHLLKQAKSPAVQNQVLSLTEDRQLELFGKLISDDSEQSIAAYARKLLQKNYRKITRQIEEMAWVDEHQLFERIYEKRYGSAYAWQPTRTVDEAVIILAIRHLLVEKVNVPAFRYLLIDEVQDYTLAQLGLLIELFPKTHFTLVGDENQAIFNSSTTFADIMRCFDDYHLPIHRYDLRNSYRSSGAITELFKTYAVDQEKIDIVSIRPQGKEPEYRSFRSSEELLKILAEILVSLKGEKAAVITQTEEETQTLQESIKKNSYGLENCQIIPLSLAKGLEFDHVILYPFENDGDEQRRRRQMYTAISRGMKSIVVLERAT